MAKKRVNKVQIVDWNDFVKNVNKGTDIPHHDSTAEKDRELKRLEADGVEWIKHVFPQYCKYPFAEFHIRAILFILKNPEFYIVLSWARSLGKSTVVFMCMMYLALTGQKKNILLISNSQNNAIRLLNDYKAAFEGNKRIEYYYGTQKAIGSWSEDEFIASCGTSFRAVGAGQSPRGTRNNEYRPDALVFDDFDTDEECRNMDIINKKWDWFEQAVY